MAGMNILLHSSKTMRAAAGSPGLLRPPPLLGQTRALAAYLKTLTPRQLAQVMTISPPLAKKTQALLAAWTDAPERQTPAIDTFIGDIYSGLQAPSLSAADREYADQTLRILSGLYGILRPLDGICPYRLEMGYKLPDPKFANLYAYWGEALAAWAPHDGPLVNLAAMEYAQAVLPFVDAARLVAPKFLTISPKTGEPAFVVVHAKIARGALARWLITQRVEDVAALKDFKDLGYRFNRKLSAPGSPAFVCEAFGGKGLSIRLQ